MPKFKVPKDSDVHACRLLAADLKRSMPSVVERSGVSDQDLINMVSHLLTSIRAGVGVGNG